MRFLARLVIALIVVVLGLGLLIKVRDVYLRHKLVGTWECTFPDGVQSKWTMERDGSSTALLSLTNGRALTTLEGTTRVEFGYMRAIVGPRLGFLLVETDTKRDGTNVIIPNVSRCYINRLTDQELVINTVYTLYDSSTFRKVNK